MGGHNGRDLHMAWYLIFLVGGVYKKLNQESECFLKEYIYTNCHMEKLTLLKHIIYEPVVVIHSFLVHLASSIWIYFILYVQNSTSETPRTQEKSQNGAHLLGKILDQEIENRYASKPMFFIMFTSSCASKNIHQASQNNKEHQIKKTQHSDDTPCTDDTRRPLHQRWHC